jgi:hypothetical protein
MNAATPSRFRTIVTDSLGLIAVIWMVPVAIVIAGLPIVLLFMGARYVAQTIW